ncbi:hypothetical protein D3C84_801340 [compost metagenome]
MTVRRAPGAHHFRRGNLVTQHFGNRTQQAGADNRVVFREDLQRHVLVDDLGHQVAQLVELIDVARIHQHAVGQGARLITGGLVRLVEQRADFRVFGEHHAVKMRDQCFAAAFQQRHSGFDDGTVLNAKHKVTPERLGFLTDCPMLISFRASYLIVTNQQVKNILVITTPPTL